VRAPSLGGSFTCLVVVAAVVAVGATTSLLLAILTTTAGTTTALAFSAPPTTVASRATRGRPRLGLLQPTVPFSQNPSCWSRLRLSPRSTRTSSSRLHVTLSRPPAEQRQKQNENEEREDSSSSAVRRIQQQQQQSEEQEEKWEADSKVVELAALGGWMSLVSAFILMNNFVGPWPQWLMSQGSVHERVWFTLHMLGGMLFGGGIVLTTAIEYMVAQNKNESVLSFWFDKVPLLDAAIVLPGLTLAMVSGTGLTAAHYGGLGLAPVHIQIVFYTLVAFAIWWAVTDLTTQGSALEAVNEWSVSTAAGNGGDDDATKEEKKDGVPDVVLRRTVSNVVSCLFVLALYAIMVLKLGALHY